MSICKRNKENKQYDNRSEEKANAKYNKTHMKSVLLSFHENNEADILAYLNKQTNKNGYIKELIREDMKGRKEISKKDIERKNP